MLILFFLDFFGLVSAFYVFIVCFQFWLFWLLLLLLFYFVFCFFAYFVFAIGFRNCLFSVCAIAVFFVHLFLLFVLELVCCLFCFPFIFLHISSLGHALSLSYVCHYFLFKMFSYPIHPQPTLVVVFLLTLKLWTLLTHFPVLRASFHQYLHSGVPEM